MDKIPEHLGIIIDGNRRWAKERGLPSFLGHKKGMDKVDEIGNLCWEKGVKVLTVFAFSTENWNRKKEEVDHLMTLFKLALKGKLFKSLMKRGIRLKVIGQKERLQKDVRKVIEAAEKKSSGGKNGIFNLAISYGGRPEITMAVKEIVKNNIPVEEIDEDLINKYLWTQGLPYPDFIIRTGGDQRLSNFLIWQAAYSELYFSKKYWPDFNSQDFEEALSDYSKRQRRFGK